MSSRTTIRFVLACLLAGMAHDPASVWGADWDRVLGLIEQSRAAFRVTRDEDVSTARQEAVDQMQAVGRVLDAAGAHGQAWKEYLRWDQLAVQLTDGAAADPVTWGQVLDRFTADHEGLELPSILRLRAALLRYYHRALARDNEELPAEFLRRVEALARLVELARQDSAGETWHKVTQHVHWFDEQEQVPEVVQAVRELAPRTNVRVCVSEDFIAGVTREAVDRVDPLTDCILGTTIVGTSHLVGTLAALPVASDQDARWEARLRGDARSQGRGYQGPVRAQLVGRAAVEAQGDIMFGPDGFRVGSTRAQVSATGRPTALWSTYHSRLADGLVTCVARRRAAKTQELGDYIASRHAEQRLEQQLAGELSVRLEPLQQDYLRRFRHPLLRHDVFPGIFQATSGAEGVCVDLLLATSAQLGAVQPAPIAHVPAAWSVQVHESAVNNLADRLLAGRTIREFQLRQFVSRLFGVVSPSAAADDATALHIVFADERPLSLSIADSLVTVRLRASNFIVQRRKYAPMTVTIRYRLSAGRDGLVATEAREPEITPPDAEEDGPRRLGSREVAARRLITQMLQRELEKSYRLGTFQLPEPAGAYGPMAVTHVTAKSGWLTVGVDRREVAENSTTESRRPAPAAH